MTRFALYSDSRQMYVNSALDIFVPHPEPIEYNLFKALEMVAEYTHHQFRIVPYEEEPTAEGEAEEG